MSTRVDPLEQAEPLSKPLMVSVTCHVALFATTLVWSMFNVPFSLGDPSGNPGGAVVVNPVNGIPLPQTRTERENPVANPVQHNVPSIPEPPQPRAEPEPAVPELDAVPIEAERKRRKAPAGNQQKYQEPLKENQVASSTGAAVSSPIYTGQKKESSGGGVGFGQGSPFGARFGWYSEALQRRLAQEWRKSLGQSRGASSKPVVMSFSILSNGTIRDIRVGRTSGNRSLDTSAFRAVTNTNPFQPLPRGLPKRSIRVEMWFQVR
jgi:TonB family protein